MSAPTVDTADATAQVTAQPPQRKRRRAAWPVSRRRQRTRCSLPPPPPSRPRRADLGCQRLRHRPCGGRRHQAALIDRLRLTPDRVRGIADGLRQVGTADPIGEVTAGKTLPNGLSLRQVRVPLGVVRIVYEPGPT